MGDTFHNASETTLEMGITIRTYMKRTKTKHRLVIDASCTIGELYRRVALLFKDTTDSELYITKHLKGAEIPLGLYYEGIKCRDPYKEARVDPEFVTTDGVAITKYLLRDTRFMTLTMFIREFGEIKLLKVYLLSDYLEHMRNRTALKDVPESRLLTGIVRKYWTVPPQPNKRDFLEYRLSQQMRFKQLNETLIQPDIPFTCNSQLVIYENRLGKKVSLNHLDIIFEKYQLTPEVPFIRHYDDDYLDATLKVRKASLAAHKRTIGERCINEDIMEKLTKKIAFPTPYMMYPEMLSVEKTLCFAVFDNHYEFYALMYVSDDTNVRVIFQKMNGLPDLTDVYVNKILKQCRSILKDISENPDYGHIGDPIPSQLEISYASLTYRFAIPTYNRILLSKIVKNLFADFLFVSDNYQGKSKIHLLSFRSSDTTNPRYMHSYVAKLLTLQTTEEEIVRLIQERFGVSRSLSQEVYSECHTLHKRPDKHEPELIVIIGNEADQISVEIQGAQNKDEVSAVLKSVLLTLRIYCHKIGYPHKMNVPKHVSEMCQDNATLRKTKERYRHLDNDQLVYPDASEEDISESGSSLEDISESDDIKAPQERDKSEASEQSDSSEESDSFGRLSSSSSQEGAGYQKRANALKGDDGEASFTNKKYYLTRLEQRDPKLFNFKRDDKETYARKCQSSNNMQPLVVTRKELEELNREFKRLNPSHEDLFYMDKHNDVKLRGFHIDGRDPDLIYLCPEYWDRKHQMILNPRLTPEDLHPIDKVPLKDVVYTKTHRDESRYVLMRNNGKYELSFIQNVHPDGYSLPCCGKKPTEYKVGSKIFAHIDSEWKLGVILKEMDSEGYYRIQIGDENHRVHISAIDRYRGDTRKLSQSFPLLKGSMGTLSPMLKDIFKMPEEFPILTVDTSFGCFRKGVSQDRDAFLEGFLIQMKQEGYVSEESDVDTLKHSILEDLHSGDIRISDIGDGSFVQRFRTVQFEGPDTYTFEEFSKKYLKKSFEKMGPSERNDTLREFSLTSAVHNFERYLKEDTLMLSVETFAEVLRQCWILRNSRVFTKPRRGTFALLVFHEINEQIKLMTHGLLSDDTTYSLFYQKDNKYEPMLSFFSGEIHGFLKKDKTKPAVTKQSYVVYEDTVAKVTDIRKGIATIVIKDTDTHITLPSKECIPYDRNQFHADLTAYDVKDVPLISPNEPPPFPVVDEFMALRPDTTLKFYYVDPYNKITHVLYQQGSDNRVFPIKPTSRREFPTIRESSVKSVFRLNQVKIPIHDALSYFKEIDNFLGERGYHRYLSDAMILTDKHHYATLLFQSGSVIPLRREPYVAELSPNIHVCENRSIWYLSSRYLEDIGETQRAFRSMCHTHTEKIITLQKLLSELYVSINQTKALQEIEDIKHHPVVLPIRKRKIIQDIVKSYSSGVYEDSVIKRFVEILYLCNDVRDISGEILRYSKECMYLGNSDPHSLQFTQRQLLNEDHLPYFEEQSLYKREVPYYGVPSQNNVRVTTQKKDTSETLVSLYTKYPQEIQKIFGKVQVYTHVVDESHSPTAMDVVEYGIGFEGIKAEVLKAGLLRILTNLAQENDLLLTGEYNRYRVGWEEPYANASCIIEEVTRDEYILQIPDYKIVSLILLSDFKEKTGFAIYTNRYKETDTDFDLVFAIHDEVFKGNLDDIRLVTLYEDYPRDPVKKPSLKNIVTYDRRGAQTVSELSDSLTFKRRYANFTQTALRKE